MMNTKNIHHLFFHMKFPYNLSQDRLTLLSEEDLRTYQYEHSPFYSYTDKVAAVTAYRNRHNYYMNMINEDHEYDDMVESEKSELATSLTQVEANMIMNEIYGMIHPLIKEGLTSDELNVVYDTLVENINQNIKESVNNKMVLNEDVPGRDLGFWLPNLGWLGKLSLSILGTGVAGLIGLFMAGKDKAAARALEKYMNRLVELTDSGVFKKKSFLSFFGKGKMRGDQSQACFRACQEIAERTIAKDVLIMGKAAGLLSGNGMDDAISAAHNGGIWQIFVPNIADSLKKFINQPDLTK